MLVLIVGGPADGSLVECPAQEEKFVHQGVRYQLMYQLFEKHPTMPHVRRAAAFAVQEDQKEVALSEQGPLDGEHWRRLAALKEWRWFP